MSGRKVKIRTIALVSGTLALLFLALTLGRWDELRIWFILRKHFESLGVNNHGYREYRHRETEIVFVRLPGGAVEMRVRSVGAPRPVMVHPFLISKYEVSQREWLRIARINPSIFRGDDLPVEQVSWNDCREFCDRTQLDLPTVAQWVLACRAGEAEHFPSSSIADVAWYESNSDGRTHAVGEKRPNAFGIHDMLGNVYEWCADARDERHSYPLALGGGWGNPTERERYGVDIGLPLAESVFGPARGSPEMRRSHIGFRPVFCLQAPSQEDG